MGRWDFSRIPASMVVRTSFELKFDLAFLTACTAFVKEQLTGCVSINDCLLACETEVKHLRNFCDNCVITELI